MAEQAVVATQPMEAHNKREGQTTTAGFNGNCEDGVGELRLEIEVKRGPKAGSARPESSIPTKPGRYCAAADVAAIASRQCLADDEERGSRLQAGAAT